ncbi:hypothetical protein Ddc_18068 [Ditylenchus destructor]|nr:hypothetical protein Ddc_18068 [Ditylenchus destructor]
MQTTLADMHELSSRDLATDERKNIQLFSLLDIGFVAASVLGQIQGQVQSMQDQGKGMATYPTQGHLQIVQGKPLVMGTGPQIEEPQE